MTDKDIWTAAGLLIKEYGEHAAVIAAQRADAFLEQGDMDGRGVWLRIMRATAALIDAPDSAAN